MLFLPSSFYVRDFPTCAELTVSYADDFTNLESGVDLDEIDDKLNQDLRRIEEWAARKELTISAASRQDAQNPRGDA